jgi:hypothetical protein
MNRYTVMAGLLLGLSSNVVHCIPQQEVEFRDGSYVVKHKTWAANPMITTTGSTLVGEDVECYVNTKDRVVLCFTKGKTWGPEIFNNIRIVKKSLGVAPGSGPDYIGTLTVEPAKGMAGGGKRLDFYQEKFVGGVQ